MSVSAFAQSKSKAPVKKAVSKAAPVAAGMQNAINNGKAVYTQYCAVCHQADGLGVPGLNPPLSKTVYVLGDQTRLINIVLKGLSEGVEIDGETYSNVMPAMGFLTDQQVADVLTYVRNSFQNKASAITAAQVKVVRANSKK
ncbi:cytochrome c [Pedobacter aquae]|uniref:Cytochrome c n=2 Tax=Pedobacter aquae TaxID=2605747 RepID=A0A5C0VR00_9SPHI|nr:cytochrome c [Pedobacter aquae]